MSDFDALVVRETVVKVTAFVVPTDDHRTITCPMDDFSAEFDIAASYASAYDLVDYPPDEPTSYEGKSDKEILAAVFGDDDDENDPRVCELEADAPEYEFARYLADREAGRLPDTSVKYTGTGRVDDDCFAFRDEPYDNDEHEQDEHDVSSLPEPDIEVIPDVEDIAEVAAIESSDDVTYPAIKLTGIAYPVAKRAHKRAKKHARNKVRLIVRINQLDGKKATVVINDDDGDVRNFRYLLNVIVKDEQFRTEARRLFDRGKIAEVADIHVEVS